MMDAGMTGAMVGYMALWGVFAVAFVVLATVAVVWLVRSMSGAGNERSAACQRLDERYAAGELSRAEYLERRDDIVRR
jgi:uncharacterized membrane protein